MNTTFFPLNAFTTNKCITKACLQLDLQHEGYTNIRYSGKEKGFFADK